jgi:hypothetical protein
LSAILKALRKIELESSSEVLGRSFPNKIDAGRVINQRAKNEWVFRRLVRVFIPVLVLAAAVLLVIAFKPSLSKDPVFFSPVPQVHGEEEKVKDLPAPARRREYAQAPGGAAKEPSRTGRKRGPGLMDRLRAVTGPTLCFQKRPGSRHAFLPCPNTLAGGIGPRP